MSNPYGQPQPHPNPGGYPYPLYQPAPTSSWGYPYPYPPPTHIPVPAYNYHQAGPSLHSGHSNQSGHSGQPYTRGGSGRNSNSSGVYYQGGKQYSCSSGELVGAPHTRDRGDRADRGDRGDKPGWREQRSSRRHVQQRPDPRRAPSSREQQQRSRQPHNDRQRYEEQSLNSRSQQSEDEQQLYQKSKQIAKKRDPVLDSPLQIRRWVEARRRNYPGPNKQPRHQGSEMSILETKIRKKIMLVTADGRGLMKKLKNMHILRRLINDPGPKLGAPKRAPRPPKLHRQAHVEVIVKDDGKDEKGEKEGIPVGTIPQANKGLTMEVNQETSRTAARNDEDSQNQQAIEQPIKKQLPGVTCPGAQMPPGSTAQPVAARRQSGPSPQEMIAHLRQKQSEDKQFYQGLLSYGSNSLNYRYSAGTLETNFLLEDIFEESSYLLQVVRYLMKTDFLRDA